MNTTAIGEKSEAIILAELVKRDYKVLMPFGNNRRYDFVLDLTSSVLGFMRVQCKTGRLRAGVVEFNAYSSGSNSSGSKSKGYKDDVDLFLIYCPDTDKVYWLLPRSCGNSKPYLRVTPTRNSQSKGVRWAKDYEIDTFHNEKKDEVAGSNPVGTI